MSIAFNAPGGEDYVSHLSKKDKTEIRVLIRPH